MILFQTKRLIIRTATKDDAVFIADLWNNPQVMKYVGFPDGIDTTPQKIAAVIKKEKHTLFDCILIITLKDGTPIGNTAIGSIDEKGITETDMKIAPLYWGESYGKETKQGLVNYIFSHTDAQIVQATPNKHNIASIKMQEYVGAQPVNEDIFTFPEDMKEYTISIPYITYHLTREDWKRRNSVINHNT